MKMDQGRLATIMSQREAAGMSASTAVPGPGLKLTGLQKTNIHKSKKKKKKKDALSSEEIVGEAGL